MLFVCKTFIKDLKTIQEFSLSHQKDCFLHIQVFCKLKVFLRFYMIRSNLLVLKSIYRSCGAGNCVEMICSVCWSLDYLEKLKWQGTKAISHFLSHVLYLNCYESETGFNWKHHPEVVHMHSHVAIWFGFFLPWKLLNH
jgi:hypothetical protein